MIRIAICDDEINVITFIQQYLKAKNKQIQHETLEISIYNSGEGFLHAIENDYKFDIVFMDIKLDGINGVEAGKILRSKPDGYDTIMIYISHHDGYFADLVDVVSFRFIKKPIDLAKLDDIFSTALTQALKKRNDREQPYYFRFKVGTEIRSIQTDRIVYMKLSIRKINLYIWDDMKKAIKLFDSFYSKINDIVADFSDGQFVRCGNASIVNLKYVKQMNKDEFIFIDSDNTRIPISRTYKEGARLAYFEYQENKI